MSKVCPKGGIMLYMDCKECDDKICKLSKKERYYRHIDSLMISRGYRRTETESNCCVYETIKDDLYYSFIKVKVFSGKRYQLFCKDKSSNIVHSIDDNKYFWKNIIKCSKKN